MNDEMLLEIKDLKIQAPKRNAPPIPIVKGVSFNVKRGEVVALIGESGSGKTTIALSALAYTKPGLEFYYKNDLITAIRIGTSTNKSYSPNKYKYSGLGLGSHINDVTKTMGQPDYITDKKFQLFHQYIYKSGILFTKRKNEDAIYTISIFPVDQFDRYAQN